MLHEFYANSVRKVGVPRLQLAARFRLGYPILLSEDFQSGRRYEGVTVITPFERSPEELTA